MTIDKNAEQTEVTHALPGDMLAQARTKLGYSQQDVANRLRLRITVIERIENNHFDNETVATFTRGYLRSYARLVGLDAEEVLHALDHLGEAQHGEMAMQSFSRKTKRDKHDNRIMKLTWVIFAAIAGITALWWYQNQQPDTFLTEVEPTAPVVSEAPAVVESPVVTEVEVTPSVESTEPLNGETATTTVAEEGLPPVSSEKDVTQTTTITENNTDATPEVTDVASTAKEPVSEPEVKEPVIEDTLSLSFAGDCWIDVRDATGKRLATGVKKSGDTLTLTGKAPYKLVLGAPAVVELTYQGKPVDLSKFSSGKVAKLTLPQ